MRKACYCTLNGAIESFSKCQVLCSGLFVHIAYHENVDRLYTPVDYGKHHKLIDVNQLILEEPTHSRSCTIRVHYKGKKEVARGIKKRGGGADQLFKR